ncbi:MAG: PAS domain-containing protein [Nitrospinae bacterium]|nr:PAS domain-containing protein [Nitrospinota bacterium]
MEFASSGSREHLERYFDALPDQVIMLDAALNVVCLNASARAFLRTSNAEVENRPLERAYMETRYGDSINLLWDALNAAREGRGTTFEALKDPDAPDVKGFEVSVRPLQGEGGGWTGIIIHMHDITLRCRSRREMALQNNHLAELARINATIIEVMSAIHIGQTLDEIFEIIFAELKKVIPYDRIGLSFLDEKGEQLTVAMVKSDNPILLHKGYSCKLSFSTLGQLLDKSLTAQNDLVLLEGGKKRIIFDLEKYVKAAGRVTPYNERLLAEGIRTNLAVPLYVANNATGFITFSSRIPNVYSRGYLGANYETCMHLLDAVQPHLALALEKGLTISRLRETNQRLKELLGMKDDFLSIASHDLRSPLTTIMGFGRLMLEKTQVNEVQRRSLDAIVNSAGHLLILVEDMLSLAKANSGKLELNLAGANIHEVLAQSINAMSFNAHNKNVVLDHRAVECATMMLDRSKIFQVFNNLIGNAIKFSPEGGKVLLHESEADGKYRFAVTDMGPGITAEDQKKLFGKFVQVGTDAAAKAAGTGLGLMICKLIVEMHGGAIGVESAPGKGSTFFFTIPLKRNNG